MARLRSTADMGFAGSQAQRRGPAPNPYAQTNLVGYDDYDGGPVDVEPGDTPPDFEPNPDPPGDPGTGDQPDPPPAPPDPPIVPPPPPRETAYNMRGFDMDKLNDLNHDSEKYKIGRVMRMFDPRQGVSRELLNALNQLGLAEFYGEGDQLGVRNTKNDPRFGQGGLADVIFALDANNDDTAWQPWFIDDQPSGGGGGGPRPPTMGGGGPSGGGITGTSTGGGGGSTPMGMEQIMEILQGLFPDGGFNHDVTTRRVSNASDALNRNRKSQLATNQARMAERGQGANDGTFGTSMGNLETRLQEGFNSSVNDIFASESENADDRMIQALQMATGITTEQARNAVEQQRIASGERLGNRNADITERLGLGNLALGNARLGSDHSLGLGRLGLDRDSLLQSGDNDSMNNMIRLLELWLSGQQGSQDGRI